MALAMVVSQATAMIPDTSAQDRPIAAAPRGWRRRLPLVLAAVAAVVALALAAPALQRMLTNERSVSATKLVVATVERGPFVRDVAGEGRVVAAFARASPSCSPERRRRCAMRSSPAATACSRRRATTATRRSTTRGDAFACRGASTTSISSAG
jgi:hypothetical protein